MYGPHVPELNPADPYDRLILREQIPDMSGKKILSDQESMSIDERRAEIWQFMNEVQTINEDLRKNHAPWHYNLDDDYHPRFFQYRERGAMGFDNDPTYREMFLQLEYMIENTIGAKHIKEKKMDMLKGTPKKWQILDDKVFDKAEIEKVQAAAKAPLPDELDMYTEKHNKPMQLPVTNANVYLWRDDQRAVDTADFDPKFLEYDRERRKQYFLGRYEKPKEIAE